jgi:hypothetical protein
MPVPDLATRFKPAGICCIVFDPLAHLFSGLLSLGYIARALLSRKPLFQRLDEVRLGAEEHSADEIGCRYSGGSLDNFEAAGSLYEPIAVLAVAVRSNVVSVYDIFAAVMGNPGQRRYIRSMWDRFGDPATSVDSSNAVNGLSANQQKPRGKDRTNRSCKVITVGPLFFRISSSECTPTSNSFPSCLACSMAPACPIGCRISIGWQRRGFAGSPNHGV